MGVPDSGTYRARRIAGTRCAVLPSCSSAPTRIIECALCAKCTLDFAGYRATGRGARNGLLRAQPTYDGRGAVDLLAICHQRLQSRSHRSDGMERAFSFHSLRGTARRRMRAVTSYLAKSTTIPRLFLMDRSYRAVNIIGAGSVLYTSLERIWFSQASPWFPRANELGTVLSEVAIGYIAAWILLYLVTWRPAYIARQAAARVVAKQIFAIFAHASQLRGVLRHAAEDPETGPLSGRELHSICSQVTFRQPSNMTQIGNPANHASVLAALGQHLRESLRVAPRIVELLPYFDSEVVLRVAALQTSDLVNLVESLLEIEPFVSPQLTLAHVERALRNHFSECNELWAGCASTIPTL